METNTSPSITVVKNNSEGIEVWRYEGEILQRWRNSIKIKAIYNNRPTKVENLDLHPGDVFVETFFSDRWYNFFAVLDSEGGHFKGWYCNITRPANIGSDRISADDLALDLIVYPDRRWAILDEDEFNQIRISPTERERAIQAMGELIARLSASEDPFDQIPSLP
jgi:protein associated with RNAse G/E